MPSITAMLKKPMGQNFAALVLLQGVNYLMPLITFPFLFRMLGVEYWGLVSFGYTVIQYFVILTDFGFNLSGTRYISMHHDNPEAINRYLNSAFVCRFLLASMGFLILLLLTGLVDTFRRESLFFLSYFGIVVGNMLFPMWYFQGMENMKYITVFNIVAKSASFIPFFLFIREPGDYKLVPFFYSIGFILAGLMSVYIIYFKEKRRWFLPGMRDLRFVFRDSFTYFLSRLSVSLFTHINTLVLGLVCGNTAVGYYSAAEKLYQAYNQLLVPFSGVLFPHIAKTQDLPFFKRVIRKIVPANLVLLTLLLCASSLIIRLVYGESAQGESLMVFRILMCGCIFTIPSILLGYPLLAAMGHAKFTNWTIVAVSVFHLAGLLMLYACNFLSLYSVAFLVVFSELILFIFRLRGIKKYRLI